ncbi:hypothetical protein JCM10213_001265 [Rhodosporidiobolus nylandii]
MTSTPPQRPSLSLSHSPTSSTSIQSLRSALSEAASTDRNARLLFSPDRASADTHGTGASGSTEGAGAATRSLVLSVDGEGEGEEGKSRPRLSDEQALSEGSWDRALSVVGSPQMGRPFVQLPTPEPEGEADAPSLGLTFSSLPPPPPQYSAAPSPGKAEGAEEDEVRIKQESDSGSELLASAAEAVEHETEAGLTNSQEDALLDLSVTRSQTQFLNRWVGEQMRLGLIGADGGGGGGSVIESDDALSSILLSTRFGAAPASPALSLGRTASFLDEPIRLEDEGLPEVEGLGEASEEEQSGAEEELVEADRKEEAAKVEEKRVTEPITNDPLPSIPSSTPSLLRWKLLSLTLSLALVYTLIRPPFLDPAPIAVEVEEPTRSLRFIPVNETLIETSHFATPLPVGSALGVPAYALLLTAVVALAASVPLVRRSLAASGATSEEDERRRRASSPLAELNGSDLLEARRLLPLGIAAYHSRSLTAAIETFSSILALACGPADKALASEWLGRAHYRLARADANRTSMEKAVAAFERSVRLDGSRAAPRASLGRAKYRLGDFAGAVAALRAAVKRDDTLAFAHEWLAKSLAAAASPRVTPAQAKQVEAHLLRAMALSPSTNAEAAAFLGEFLHTTPCLAGRRTADAKKHLLAAVALRADYPAAHARLAFIANEQLDPVAAAAHYAAVCDTRASGLRDECLAMSEEATRGAVPWKGWVFVTPPASKERRSVLERAVREEKEDELLGALLCIERAAAPATPPARRARSASPSAEDDAASAALGELHATLTRRALRYTPAEDPLAHGLLALVSLALPASAVEHAQHAYEAFWAHVSARPALPAEASEEQKRQRRAQDREFAFVAMAFYELRRRREERDGNKDVDVEETPKKASAKGRKALPPAPAAPAETRRRARSSTPAAEASVAADSPARRTRSAAGKAQVVEEQEQEVPMFEIRLDQPAGEEVAVEKKAPLRRSSRRVKKEEA